MSALTFILQALAYEDLPPTSNPKKTNINRQPSLMNVPVENAGSTPWPIDPGATQTIFDGQRATAIDNTTAFDLTLSPADASTYRLAWTGTGTAPAFRIDRGADCSGIALTLTVAANLRLTIQAASGTPFHNVVAGDTALIPGVSTGDPASPFNALNEGYWTVLSSDDTHLTLARNDDVFNGISEGPVTPSTPAQLQVFSSAGVQNGDTVDISAGFAPAAQNSFDISAVAPGYIEFRSTAPLGDQTAIVPGAGAVVVYTSAKRFVLVETDQPIIVRWNGDTGNTNRCEPLLAGDGVTSIPGSQHKFGTAFKLVVVNRSSVRATVTISSAE